MKKIMLGSLMSIVALGIVSYSTFFVKTAGASTEPNIQDPTLLEAWGRLDNHHDPIQLWDGQTLTGHDLAQYLLEHGIPVVWDTEHVCGDGSCSVLYCAGETCTYEDGEPGPDPIYVYPTKADDMQSLVATLAHETFHRTQPFGAVLGTRFEEYWAFLIGAQVSQAEWPTFAAYDPLVSGYLTLWIRDHNLAGYYRLPEYPAAVAPLVESANRGLDQFNSIPAEAYGTGQEGAKP